MKMYGSNLNRSIMYCENVQKLLAMYVVMSVRMYVYNVHQQCTTIMYVDRWVVNRKTSTGSHWS